MATFAVREFPIYPASELETALNGMAADGYTLVQAFEQKAGTGQTGRSNVTTQTISGAQAIVVRTTAVFIFFK